MKQFTRAIAIIVFLTVLAAPAYLFFDVRGGTDFLAGLSTQDMSLALFPLVGLYALTLLWFQIMLGSNLAYWETIFPRIRPFHYTEGVFALLLALLHPTLRVIGHGFETYSQDIAIGVAPSLRIWLVVGYLQLFLLVVTVATALLRRAPWMSKRWHKLHLLNYAVFGLAWLHSWFLGTDVQTTNLRWLWIFFAVSAVAAVAFKVYEKQQRQKKLAAFEG